MIAEKTLTIQFLSAIIINERCINLSAILFKAAENQNALVKVGATGEESAAELHRVEPGCDFSADRIMKYYSLRKCLSYNRYLNILIGGRGIGKTYQLKKYVIEQYLKSKKQFVWVRRYKTEIKEATDGFFTKHKNNYPGHKFSIRGKTAYIDGKQAGRFIALTNADILKGSDDFSAVTTIVYDEFIIDNKSSFRRYLPNELRVFTDLQETIFRTRQDGKVFMLANALSMVNPYCLAFGIKFHYNPLFKNDLIYAEMLSTTNELAFAKATTPQNKLATKYLPEYNDYANNESFLNDDYSQIERKPKDSIQLFNIKTNNNIIYFFFASSSQALYACKAGDPKTIPLTVNKIAENNRPHAGAELKKIKSFAVAGRLFFENLQIKSEVEKIIYNRL